MGSLAVFAEALLIVTALSVDAFVSCFAYGASQIRVPFSSAMVINLICGAILALALLLGGLIGSRIPPEVTSGVCFFLLLGLGLSKIFDSAVKALIRRHQAFQKDIHFSLFQLGFILSIYANPEAADRDHSRVLSPSEAAFLALALSLDGLAVGFGTGMIQIAPLLIIALSLVSNLLCILLGCFLGARVTRTASMELNWLSGLLLILLAISKLP